MDDNIRTIDFALEFLREILRDLGEYIYIFLLTDLNGKVRHCISNIYTLPSCFNIGTSWSEEKMGKTALSLAMKTQKLSYMRYSEHSNPFLQRYFSLAAPFFDCSKKTMGYLVFLGDEPERINMSKGLLRACVKNIENSLKVHSALQDLRLKTKYENAIITSIHDGFLVLQPDCVITHANKKAAALLNVKQEQLIGARLTDLVESPLKIKEVFETGRAIIDEETFVKLPNRTLHIIKTAVPIHDEEGKVIAVIDNFKEIKDVRNLVNQMVGAKAIFTFNDIIYQSKEMAETIRMAQAAAKGPLSVLIQGESGTGKELFAHAIHNSSARKNGPFVIIDCASIPRELVESELFGYVEGAFTGARRGGRLGKFELANGGTIFLDEIGEIPLEVQAKFLRVLQNHSIVRVGGSENIPVNIRVIAATNRNLQEQVKLGNFREDLFYRLNVLTVNIPPLRARPVDIEILVEYFLKKYENKLAKRHISLSKEALNVMKNYNWPGNVRELENALVRAISLSDGVIMPFHLPINVTVTKTEPKYDNYQPGLLSLTELEKRSIIEALKLCKGNRSKAAKALGIARSTLYKKLEFYDLVNEL